MKVPAHLVTLYNRTLRRYRKLAVRLKREKNPTSYRYLTLVNRLRKLRKKIERLHVQLRVATASGALVLGLSLSSHGQTTNNGPFVSPPRHEHPMREPYLFKDVTYPAFADIDQDGDLDMLVADESGVNYNMGLINPMRYFRNRGSDTEPVYEELFGSENPFVGIDTFNIYRAPVFADIDNDGDADLFLSLSTYEEGGILYFRNENGTFVEQTTAWDPVAKTGNPLLNVPIRDHQKLALGDMDNDGDLDAIITGIAIDDVSGSVRYISFYRNDGTGTFTDASDEMTFTPEITNSFLNPALADVDEDGDLDLVMGGYYVGSPWDQHQGLYYYKQVSPGVFEQEVELFDPDAGTGNPFSHIYYPNTQPVFADLDGDGDLDLLVGEGDGDHYSFYPIRIIHYFENKGSGVFEELKELSNPFGGIHVKEAASPFLVDLDDDGDLDAVIGHKYNSIFVDYNTPYYYEFENDTFQRTPLEENPFNNVMIYGNVTPTMVDLDGDGDLDLVTGNYTGTIQYFRNDDGVYNELSNESPFADIDVGSYSSPEFGDLDGDGDLDMIALGRGWPIRYFENTGTAQSPVFEERTEEDSPFNELVSPGLLTGALTVADVDHDGDLDLLVAEYSYFKYYQFDTIRYYENTGTPTTPVFTPADEQPFDLPKPHPYFDFNSIYMRPHLADQDQDGDLDLFVGDLAGHVRYLRNDNPPVVTSVASGTLTYRPEIDEDIAIDPNLTLADEDDDLVVRADVTIVNYEAGDELLFTAVDNIAGHFDTESGVLTFTGKATRDEYQSLLRSVTYRFVEDTDLSRKAPRKKYTIAKSIEFRVYDTDFTHPEVASRGLNVLFNESPIVQSASETTYSGEVVSIPLIELLSDPDDNLDLSTLKIVVQPTSGANATIDANHNLVVNYAEMDFAGSDQVTIEVCDDLGACAQNVITIDVEQTEPGTPVVHNAVAPNSNGDNKFMRIFHLPEGNRITIFSRWGDKVFEMENYNHDTPAKRFEGNSDNGKPLPSGTYFYKLEITGTPTYKGPKLITGYLTLKQ